MKNEERRMKNKRMLPILHSSFFILHFFVLHSLPYLFISWTILKKEVKLIFLRLCL